MLWIQLLLLGTIIVLSTQYRGMSLGLLGSLGVAILAFAFHVPPTAPPFDALLAIIAVVTAVGTMEAAGGLQYVIHRAERLLKQYPHRILWVAPGVTYAVVAVAGTGHIVYSLLPIIAAVAQRVGIRPAQPLSLAVIAGLHAVLVSPISAPTALVVGFLAPHGIALREVLLLLVPATVGGILAAILVAIACGQRRSAAAAGLHPPQEKNPATEAMGEHQPPSRAAKLSVGLFVGGGGMILALRLLHRVPGLKMTALIALIMFSVAALTILLGRLRAAAIVTQRAFLVGIEALIAILGIAWLSDTLMQAHQAAFMAWLQATLTAPWQFSLVLFATAALMLSNVAVIRAMIPLGMALGLPASTLLAAVPAVSGLFFFPTYPTLLAAVRLDRTGTTRIGKLLLNHSFMVPGLVATAVALLIAFALRPYVCGG